MSTPDQPQDPYAAGDQPQQPGAGATPPPGATPPYPVAPQSPPAPQYPAAPQYPSAAPQYPAAGQPPAYGAGPQYPATPAYPGAAPYGQYGQQGAYAPLVGYPKNGLGVWSFVLGLLAFLLCGPFTGVPALIVGSQSRKAVANGEANNGGMAVAGIVLAWVGIAFWLLSVFWLTANWGTFQESFEAGYNGTY